jgi:hypothetical protein
MNLKWNVSKTDWTEDLKFDAHVEVPDTTQGFVRLVGEKTTFALVLKALRVALAPMAKKLREDGFSADDINDALQQHLNAGMPRSSGGGSRGGASLQAVAESASRKGQLEMVRRTLTSVGFSEAEINQLIESHGLDSVLAVVFGSGLKPGDVDTDDDVDNEDEEADA